MNAYLSFQIPKIEERIDLSHSTMNVNKLLDYVTILNYHPKFHHLIFIPIKLLFALFLGYL